MVDNLKEIEFYTDELAKNIYRTHESINCLKEIIEFANHPIGKRCYGSIVDHLYRIHFDTLYLQICKFFDEDDKALSFYYVLNLSNTKELLKKYKNTQLLAKIKAWRNKVVAHLDREYSHPVKRQEFYESNKTHLDEIISFVNGLQTLINEILEIIGSNLSIFGLWDSPTHYQLRDMFEGLKDNSNATAFDVDLQE